MSDFIGHCESTYQKFEQAMRQRLRLPARSGAPRKAKTRSVLQNLLSVQAKALKRKPARPRKLAK